LPPYARPLFSSKGGYVVHNAAARSRSQSLRFHASHYDGSSGSKVACGGELDESALTAAHKTLPCGTRLRVENKQNGRSVTVTINDRGPFLGAIRAACRSRAFILRRTRARFSWSKTITALPTL
jgi:hypothetical protein